MENFTVGTWGQVILGEEEGCTEHLRGVRMGLLSGDESRLQSVDFTELLSSSTISEHHCLWCLSNECSQQLLK